MHKNVVFVSFLVFFFHLFSVGKNFVKSEMSRPLAISTCLSDDNSSYCTNEEDDDNDNDDNDDNDASDVV